MWLKKNSFGITKTKWQIVLSVNLKETGDND